MPTDHGVRTLEIAVQDPVGARLALAAGADRVELCSALSTGGLTPSIGLVHSVVEAVAEAPGFVQVLVRPREGGFVYDVEEIETTARDVAALRGTGVGGVVVGALTSEGSLDLAAMECLIEAAGDLTVTFHRAIDVCPDPLALLELLLGLGVDRILTSGGAVRSIDGLDVISALAQRAGDQMQISAGGGVRVADIPALLGAGAASVHLSARTLAPRCGPTGPGGGAESHHMTDANIVAETVAAVAACNAW